MRPVSITVSSATTSGVIVPDYRAQNFQVTVSVIVAGTNTSKVQYTTDDVFATTFDPTTANWFDVATLNLLTASAIGYINFPVTGIRLNVTAYTNGSATIKVIESAGPGG